MNDAAVHLDFMHVVVEHNVLDLDHLSRRAFRCPVDTAQDGLQTYLDLPKRKGLGNVVVGAQVETVYDVVILV